MNRITLLRRWWHIGTAALGLLIVANTGFVAGNLADALAGQPDLGDGSAPQLVTLFVIGLVMVVGGAVFAVLEWRGSASRQP
jgi:hypothetical protein